jgi:hypothetical protein
MPSDVALGLMMNLSTANGWKTVPVLQGVGLAFANKAQVASFAASLTGRSPSIREQIAAHFRTDERRPEWPSA